VFFRPKKSDSDAQTKRPPMLKVEISHRRAGGDRKHRQEREPCPRLRVSLRHSCAIEAFGLI
jgi:hypothetical protein